MARDFTPIPNAALILGLAGLIPFWGAVLMLVISTSQGRSPVTEMWLFTIYSGLIATFLGGVRWGESIASKATPGLRALGLSIAPSLVALLAVFIHWSGQPVIAWSLLALCFGALLIWDRRSVERRDLPVWYGRLRLVLTTGVVLAHLAISLGYLVLAR